MLVNTHPSVRGFTIFELLIVVAIVAILAVVALPSFTSAMALMRVKTLAGEIQSSLTHARSEAMKRNATVTVSPASSGWKGGWTTTITVAGVTTTLQQREAMSVGTQHLTTTPQGLETNGSVVFRSNGRSNTPDGYISIVSTDTTSTRCVKISLSGPPIVRESCS